MMTIHQHHHIIENENGFYCQTCADQAAIEADLRNDLTRVYTELSHERVAGMRWFEEFFNLGEKMKELLAERDNAQLRTELDKARVDIARLVASLRSIKAHNSMYTHSLYIDNECADGLEGL